MYNKIVLSLLLSFAFVFSANAQLPIGTPFFSSNNNPWQEKKPEPLPKTPLRRFADEIDSYAMKNIFEAEQAFCYEIFPKDEGYLGYILDGFPIRGFCGTLTAEEIDTIRRNLFSAADSVDFTSSENCLVQPKIMFRFVRGVDHTDVLLSSPCHAIAVFYGDRTNAYNFRPGAKYIEETVKNMNSRHQEFVSPALLNQTVPNGTAKSEEQRKLIKKDSEPIRKWQTETQKKVEQQDEETVRQNTGWNKLKDRLQ